MNPLPCLLVTVAVIACALSGCSSGKRAQQKDATQVDATAKWMGEDGANRSLAGSQGQAFIPIVHPDFPVLPEDTSPKTTVDQLAIQALLVARSQHERGLLEGEQIPQRQSEIMEFWRPQYIALVQSMAGVAAAREAEHAYLMKEARHRAEWEAKIAADQLAWDVRLEQERLRVLPLLPPDLEARLWQQYRRNSITSSRVARSAP